MVGRRGLDVVLATLLATGMLTACHSGQAPEGEASSSAAEAWESEVEQARGMVTSDFQKQVLADGVVTEGEYLEALQRVVECYTANGHPADLMPEWFGQRNVRYETGDLTPEESIELDEKCMASNTHVIEGLYHQMLVNPNHEDFERLVVKCLIDYEIVPADYTAEQYKKDGREGQYPFSLEDPQVQRCEQDPKGLTSGGSSTAGAQ